MFNKNKRKLIMKKDKLSQLTGGIGYTVKRDTDSKGRPLSN